MSFLPRTLRRAAAPLVPLALFAALSATAGLARAATWDFLFTGHGSATVTPCADAPTTCADVVSSGVANDWAGLDSPIPTSWDVLVGFQALFAGGGMGTLESGSFVYADTGPDANSFLGSFTAAFEFVSPTLARSTVSYSVIDGTGLFAGATGTGTSSVYFDFASGNYAEAGSFSIAAVPEPSTWLMLAGGLAAIGALRRRRAG